MAAIVLLATVVAVAPGGAVSAAGPFVEAKFLASNAFEEMSFGHRLAAGGDTIAVSTPREGLEFPTSIDELVYVLRPDASGVITETQISPAGYPPYTPFGDALAVSDDGAILVGHTVSFAPDNDAGSAYLFSPNGGGGYTETRFTSSDGSRGDAFGSAVALSGETLVVGAPGEDSRGDQAGAAYVYEPDGAGGFSETKLTAFDGRLDDRFGSAVAIAGDTIVVGAPNDNNTGRNTGSIYVFTPDGAGGYTTTRLEASDRAAEDRFGRQLAIAADAIVVGVQNDDVSRGAAYVFEPDGTGSYSETKLTLGNRTDYERFGAGVAGDAAGRILVGAIGGIGKAVLYEPNGAGGYEETVITASDGVLGDRFGTTVALLGESIVVGASGDDDRGNSSGSVYLFEPTSVQSTCNGLTAEQAAAEGYNVIDLRAETAVQDIVGTSGPDFVLGSDFRDILRGGDGDDVICGRGGNDGIFGNKGADFLDGGDGDDRIDGNRGPDTILGGFGDDELDGSGGTDSITGGHGDDRIFGGGGDDLLEGNEGDDRIAGNLGDDTIDGGEGSDRVIGGGGTDSCVADDPSDTISECDQAPLAETILRADDPIEYRRFGQELATSGQNIVVSSQLSGDFNGNPPAVALLYQPDGAGGFNETALEPTGVGRDDFSRAAVAIEGSTIALGADDEGVVVLFRADGAGGFVETELRSPSGERGQFGRGVAITPSGRIVVGAPNDAGGSAHVFAPDGAGGFDTSLLIAPDPVSGLRFGESVAADQETIVVGRPGDRSVYVFKPNGAGGYTGTKLEPAAGSGSADDGFGSVVATSDRIIVVGAPNDNDNGSRAGAAYVFEPDGAGGYNQVKLVASDGASDDFFARSVAVADGRILVGAFGNDDNGDFAGAAYLFDANGPGSYAETKIVASDGSPRDGYGAAVEFSDGRIIVGAPGDDDGGDLSPSGSVYIYEG